MVPGTFGCRNPLLSLSSKPMFCSAVLILMPIVKLLVLNERTEEKV